jgi:hypothetical protein
MHISGRREMPWLPWGPLFKPTGISFLMYISFPYLPLPDLHLYDTRVVVVTFPQGLWKAAVMQGLPQPLLREQLARSRPMKLV